MEFLNIPLPPTLLHPPLREYAESPVLHLILRAMQHHALNSLATAAQQAANGESSSYQLGAAAGLAELGLLLYTAAHEPDPTPEQEGEA
jgi:hypothetical protein